MHHIIEIGSQVAERRGVSLEALLNSTEEVSSQPPVATLGAAAVFGDPPVIAIPVDDEGRLNSIPCRAKRELR
jgi:hypothetical protein